MSALQMFSDSVQEKCAIALNIAPMSKDGNAPHYLRQWMTAKNVSVRKLSELIVDEHGEPLWSPSAWQHICTNKQSPTLNHLRAASKALGVSVSDLVSRDPNTGDVGPEEVASLLEELDQLEKALQVALAVHGLTAVDAPKIAATLHAMLRGFRGAGVSDPSDQHWQLAKQLLAGQSALPKT